MAYAVKINATTDGNGNPRRGWIIYGNDGTLIGFKNEGYRGNLDQVRHRLYPDGVTELGGNLLVQVVQYNALDLNPEIEHF
jgi:hypothetical protein